MASSSSRPGSVRGLYTPPAEEWVFLPPTVSPPSSSSSMPPPSHLPSLPPSPSSLNMDDPQPFTLTPYAPLQTFASEWLTTALGLPFDVGKTLLQVEYRPRRRYSPPDPEPIPLDGEGREGLGEEDEEERLREVEEAELYFTDRISGARGTYIPPPPTREQEKQKDSKGYLPDLPTDFLLVDDPEVSRSNGVWGMMRRIRATPGEGVGALWKSQLISTFHALAADLLQPHIHSFLSMLSASPLPGLDIPLTAFPAPAIPLGMQVGSHLLTHLLLSPMEVIRTRLIVAPSGSTTPSSLGMFRELVNEEGGFVPLFLDPGLLFPAVLEHTLRPLLTLSIPLVLERQWGISPDLAPLTYSLCDLGLGLASLVVLLPVETVRKRLQLQRRGTRQGENVRSVVRLRERPYVGVVEAIWRISTEETGRRRKRVMSEKDEGGWFSGVRQLYRGFGMAAMVHFTVFGLGLVSASLGDGRSDSGWKEI